MNENQTQQGILNGKTNERNLNTWMKIKRSRAFWNTKRMSKILIFKSKSEFWKNLKKLFKLWLCWSGKLDFLELRSFVWRNSQHYSELKLTASNNVLPSTRRPCSFSKVRRAAAALTLYKIIRKIYRKTQWNFATL